MLAQGSPEFFFSTVALIIFVETGLVIMPLLPGDSLLFVAGTVTAVAGLPIHALVILLIVAAVLGDSVNYWVGKQSGLAVFETDHPRLQRIFRRDYLVRTQAFYERYGAFSIVIGRFVPIVRTFVPFLAGVARMHYGRFLTYNILGGVLWITSLTYAGYFFGNLPWVRANLSLIVLAIVVASILPIVVKVWQERRRPLRR
ncbi:MAG: VTT domain-containing protein [Casimicrobiaceae bacterium]|nr:VTT domain-containing protein [Casimicrobiaceae bacterium]MCX8097908.1 VTT domain-containing protein [Casimicrobiaceae bacterium]MDW8312732.1 VTT domain-containing protein [Burkholderiales bacterium]